MAKPSENLIMLCRAAVEAHHAATAVPYTQEGWAPWLEASAVFQSAVTEEAGRDPKQSRYELEQAAKKAVLHPEGDGD
ncbi:hypothetical protein [Streptomyces microflavus]|uniref:hypothetical protein n=1 Tax=Streptomyces microflavus TaxID=1919 RepID=UPI002E359150|nr:hypothetical protein [Streptomyces microflavus]